MQVSRPATLDDDSGSEPRQRPNSEPVSKSAFVDGFFLGSADLLFRLEPVVQFRAGLIPSLDVQFVRSAEDTFFEWKCFDWGLLLCRCGGRHGISPPATTLAQTSLTACRCEYCGMSQI